MLQHLDKPLKDFHQEYDKRHPKTFGGKFTQLLSNFAEWAGIKSNKAEGIIKNTIKCIEEGFDTQNTGKAKTHKFKENKYTKLLKDAPHISEKVKSNRSSSATTLSEKTRKKRQPEERRR